MIIKQKLRNYDVVEARVWEMVSLLYELRNGRMIKPHRGGRMPNAVTPRLGVCARGLGVR
jgi:hypothetical protein